MKIPRHCFREYDVRGVAERDLSSEVAFALGAAFASRTAAKRIAVGRDGRLSSPRLFEHLTAGIRSAGADVIAVGIGPTPLLYFAAHSLAVDASVMITGSHNPGEDNGFKMMKGKASFYGDDIQRLAADIENEQFKTGGQGSLENVSIESEYIAHLRSCTRIETTDIRFVIDAGNGSAGPLGEKTLRALGFSPEALFCTIDGAFPNHHPDPTVPANLKALIDRVRETKSTLGIAWDGDGDRIGAVDRDGTIVWGDKLLLLFARAVLAENPGGAILGEVKCSQTLYDDIARHGGRPIMWKTGHSLIKTKMKEEHALLAGEMSGHMFFADRHPGFDDAIYASVRLLEIIGRTKKTLGELLADVPVTHVTPEIRVDCEEAIKFKVVEGVQQHFRKTHAVVDIDGARIDFGDSAWGLCRASNTQPVLVLRFEAKSEKRRDEIRAEVESVVAHIQRQLRQG